MGTPRPEAPASPTQPIDASNVLPRIGIIRSSIDRELRSGDLYPGEAETLIVLGGVLENAVREGMRAARSESNIDAMRDRGKLSFLARARAMRQEHDRRARSNI